MRVLLDRLLNEPALALGLLGSLIVLVFKLAGDDSISANDLLELLAPFGVGAGTRQLVTPYYQPSNE